MNFKRNHNILLFIPGVPYPLTEGGIWRYQHLLRIFKSQHLYLIVFYVNDHEVTDELKSYLGNCCEKYLLLKRKSIHLNFWVVLRSYIKGLYPLYYMFYSLDYLKLIQQFIENINIDLIWIEQVYAGLYGKHLNSPKLIISTHNAEAEMFKRFMLKSTTNPLRLLKKSIYWNKMRRDEIKILKEADVILAVSKDDCNYFSHLLPDKNIVLLPNFVDIHKLRMKEKRSIRNRMIRKGHSYSVCFTGKMSYFPNIKSVMRIANNIMPLIWRKYPDSKFYIVGRDPSPEIQRLAGDRIVVTGYVDSILPYLERSDVFLAPFDYGGGMRYKLIEAMAFGIPVLTTKVGVEGIELETGDEIIIEEKDARIAEKVIDLFENDKLREKYIQKARSLVEKKYSFEANEPIIYRIIDSM